MKRCTEYIPVGSVEVIEASTVVYDITVDELHNFCVTTEDVYVHNVVPFVADVTFTWAFGGGLVPAVSGLFALGAFAVQAVFRGAFVPRTVELDFDADKFGERFGSRPPYSTTEKEDKDLDAQAPGKPTEADGFIPPRNWSGKKEKHRRGWGWRDKRGSIWIPTGPKGHGGPHWDVQHEDGSYENIVPGGRRRGENES